MAIFIAMLVYQRVHLITPITNYTQACSHAGSIPACVGQNSGPSLGQLILNTTGPCGSTDVLNVDTSLSKVYPHDITTEYVVFSTVAV